MNTINTMEHNRIEITREIKIGPREYARIKWNKIGVKILTEGWLIGWRDNVLFVGIRELFLLNHSHRSPTDNKRETQTGCVSSYGGMNITRV